MPFYFSLNLFFLYHWKTRRNKFNGHSFWQCHYKDEVQ